VKEAIMAEHMQPCMNTQIRRYQPRFHPAGGAIMNTGYQESNWHPVWIALPLSFCTPFMWRQKELI
jgi:hypothetical protein